MAKYDSAGMKLMGMKELTMTQTLLNPGWTKLALGALALCFHVSAANAQAPVETTLGTTTTTMGVGEVQFQFEGCFSASAFAKTKVVVGQKVRISAWLDASCDSRGWTNAGTTAFSGPEGRPGEWPADLAAGGVAAPLGLLVGTVVPANYQVDGNMSLDWWRRIFQNRAFLIGKEYFGFAPTTGWLYLIMNDGYGYNDNLGSIKLKVTITNP